MASTIKLKNGSGAPLASDLVAGEPALDLTNKRLYTEDSGGTVIEVGTNPTEIQIDNINIDGNTISSTDTNGNITLAPNGTGVVDVTGTVTADGLQVSGNATFISSTPQLFFDESDVTGQNLRMRLSSGNFDIDEVDDALAFSARRMQIDMNTGDISFYEDTGTTAKFFWDASAERVNVGNLYLGEISSNYDKIQATSSAGLRLQSSGGSVYLDSSGNVGVGTASPSYTLDVENATDNGIARFTSGDADVFIVLADSGTTGTGNRIGAISDDMYFKTASTTRMTIDSSGNVGIGDTNPTTKLALYQTGDVFVGIDNDQAGNKIIIGKQGATAYGATGVGEAAIYTYDNSISIMADGGAGNTSSIKFSTGGNTERMRIDSDGNLLVGTTRDTIGDDSGTNTNGSNIFADGTAVFGKNGNRPLIVNRGTNDGDLVQLKKDGATVGSIGTQGGTLEVGSGDVYLQFNGTNDWIKPVDGSGSNKPNVDLGTSGAQFKNLYLSGGVVFDDAGGSGTATSNTLDSYEEGTWTPQFNDEGGGGDFTSAGVNARYTKVGRLVHIHLWVNGVTNSGSVSISGNLKLDDLPFTCDAAVAGTSIIRARNISSGEVFSAQVLQSGTSILFYKDSTETRAATSDLLFTDGGTNDRVIITLAYLAA